MGPSKTVTIEVSDFDYTVQVLGQLVEHAKAGAQGSDDPEVWRPVLALGFLEYALNPDD
jgi:hypothetical protein